MCHFKYTSKIHEMQEEAEKKRQLLMQAIRRATENGSCIILGEAPGGTRVIVIGKSLLQRQVEEILKDKGVDDNHGHL